MKKTIILSLIIISVINCCKKDDCKETPVDIQNFETDYGCHNTKYGLKIDLNNNVTVITSDADYNSKVTGECHPDIDFDVYSLLIGKQALTNLNDTILYTFKRACPDEKLTLIVDIVQTSEVHADTVVYHAIVAKSREGEQLNVQLNIQNLK